MTQQAKNLIAQARTEGWTRLDLGRCNLSNLQTQVPELFELEQLEELVLSNRWWEWEDSTQKWEQKESSNKGHANFLSQLPQAMAQLKQLKVLVYGGGSWDKQWAISDIGALQSLTQLTTLDLCNNQISDIGVLQSLTQLTNLYLSSNQISDIGVLKSLTQLTTLNLGGNQISDIGVLQSLTQLTNLYLSSNQISDIGILKYLTQLTTLYLSDNQISDIGVLQSLTQLTTLYLSYNQISDIGVLQSLTQLTNLNLWSNKISDLSPLLTHYKKGVWINVDDNPITTPPLEIVRQGTAAVLRYFEELEKGVEKLMEAKVLLVGQGQAGKTSLKVKLLDVAAQMPAEGDTTRTIEISTKEYAVPDSKALILNYWDFGGQNIQHYAHQFFLTDNALYLLLSNDREQNPNFQYWLNIIELLGKNSRVLIVQNQKQGHCEPIKNAAAIRERFPNVISPFYALDISKVDNEHSQQYAELTKSIVHHALALPTTQRTFARSFVHVRRHLEALSLQDNKHYISWKEYLDICQKEGVPYATAEDYAQAYTSVGVCLHYPDHPQLCEYVFLRPKWIIDALFDLLYSDEIKNGELDSSQLRHIWQGSEYANMRGNLLLLMEQFELCYRVQDSNHIYIVPQRLPLANDSYNFDLRNVVRVVYRYKFMPKGIITRLICRMKTKIRDVWSDAMVLSYRNETALVHEVYSENEIEIKASVVQNSDLLNIIIDAIDTIHQSFLDKNFNLKVSKEVPCICPICQNSSDPHYFDYDYLRDLIMDGETEERCQKSRKKINIVDLLNGTKLNYRPSNAVSIFISYAQEDHEHLKALKKQLSPLINQNKITVWDNQKILASQDRDKETEQHLQNAVVVVLLISSDFLSNDHIMNEGIPIIMQKRDNGQLVIPIVVRDCNWQWEEQLAKIQAVNKGKPLNHEADKDTAFANAARQIQEAIANLSN